MTEQRDALAHIIAHTRGENRYDYADAILAAGWVAPEVHAAVPAHLERMADLVAGLRDERDAARREAAEAQATLAAAPHADDCACMAPWDDSGLCTCYKAASPSHALDAATREAGARQLEEAADFTGRWGPLSEDDLRARAAAVREGRAQ